jgi:hypothetical protein
LVCGIKNSSVSDYWTKAAQGGPTRKANTMDTKKALALAIILAPLLTTAAYPETYNYFCKVGGKTYPLLADENTNILTWRGQKDSITVAHGDIDEPDGCAKYGWIATGDGTSFKFCAATQGVGTIEYKDGSTVDCDQHRERLHH